MFHRVILVDNRNSSDPYTNLAIEEYLVRHADCRGKDYLLLYINEPCIVTGKNQSIYKEINFEFLRNGKLKLARRITGGGTVYQDAGNLNFSFISEFAEEKINNYKLFNQPLVDALRKADVNAEIDSRNNILCNGKKISGNAQFTNRNNIISHGTLLLNADLDMLHDCLKENKFKIETKAVGSVRSSVMNICEATERFSSAVDLKNFLAEELNTKETYYFAEKEWNAIQKLAEEKFKSFEWIYGRSPFTKIYKKGMEIEVENGIIQKPEPLIGMKYEFNEINKLLNHADAMAIM